ncbi:putative RNA-directed DNA polymerase [Rosa chinensis]|uniref:Putative RNA-directed DNA polymerase n=1 Tax=Rosa chinensis TaxID=74649 RepID=A0A2P6P2R0_ROSCH|nr:putative RNA-directed DNA polymerase [Rosa chinensis]
MHQNMDLCLIEEQPLELDTDSTEEDRKYYKEWYQCNRKAKNVIRSTMSNTVRGSIVEPDLAMDFLEAIADKYRESHKAEAARLSKRFNELKFSGSGSVREHIMELIEINARLRDMGMGVNDEQVVHVALFSLPSDYSNLRTSYNATESKWDLNKLISICVDEEDRVKKEKETTKAVNLVEKPKWKKHNKLKLKKTTNTKVSGKPADSKAAKPFKFKCYFCKKVGHMKKECSGFKAWMIKKGFNKQEGAKE